MANSIDLYFPLGVDAIWDLLKAPVRVVRVTTALVATKQRTRRGITCIKKEYLILIYVMSNW